MSAPLHQEARRLLAKGFKLCKLHDLRKIPVGNGWQLSPVSTIDDGATGYGFMLAANGLASIDPDNLEPAREGMRRCGWDLDKLMNAGVRTTSTRPGSGGRSTFKATPGLTRVTFSSKQHGTILELRAGGSNLMDCLPGTRYQTVSKRIGKGKTAKDIYGKTVYVQAYANGKAIDDAPDLPADFLAWWRRLNTDLDFKREQQAMLCGPGAVLAVSCGDELAYKSHCRRSFNETHDVVEILERHGYSTQNNERWSPPSATGGSPV